MGTCRNCNRKTRYPHNNGWCPLCFHFNYKEPRMYLSLILTPLILQLPLIDGIGFRAWLMKTLYDAIGWQPFLLASIFINILIIAITYFGTSTSIYKIFKKFK